MPAYCATQQRIYQLRAYIELALKVVRVSYLFLYVCMHVLEILV